MGRDEGSEQIETDPDWSCAARGISRSEGD